MVCSTCFVCFSPETFIAKAAYSGGEFFEQAVQNYPDRHRDDVIYLLEQVGLSQKGK